MNQIVIVQEKACDVVWRILFKQKTSGRYGCSKEFLENHSLITIVQITTVAAKAVGLLGNLVHNIRAIHDTKLYPQKKYTFIVSLVNVQKSQTTRCVKQ